jgi:hypothetical protein
MQLAAQEWAAMWEVVFGGQAHSSDPHTMTYEPPEGGVGGMVGGAFREASLRAIPIEKHPTQASLIGMEGGAGLVPVLDPAERLVTGQTVTGRDTSRAVAAVELALDVVPFALEAHAMAAESREARILRVPGGAEAEAAAEEALRPPADLAPPAVTLPAGPPLLSDAELVARSQEIFSQAAAAFAAETGKPLTTALKGQLRGELTVGVLQGEKGAKVVTLVGMH